MAVAWAVAVSTALLILLAFNPSAHQMFPPCPLHWFTGLYCPGCGSLRAVHSLLHGDVASALSMNSLMVVSIPIVGLLFLKPAWTHKQWVPWLVFSVVVAYGFARNIPAWPFTLLAP
jgi:hypothetical protein